MVTLLAFFISFSCLFLFHAIYVILPLFFQDISSIFFFSAPSLCVSINNNHNSPLLGAFTTNYIYIYIYITLTLVGVHALNLTLVGVHVLNLNLRIVPSILHSSATRDPVVQW